MGGVQAVLDVVAALASEDLDVGGIPAAQEELLARLGPGPADTARAGTAAVEETPDAVADMVGDIEPFSGRLPHVDALALDRQLTSRLVERCRAEGTSVHGALIAAAAVVMHRRGQAVIRVLSPIDLRRAAGLAEEVVVRFTAGRTVSGAADAEDFWALARHARDSLDKHRNPDVLKAASQFLTTVAPSTSAEAEAAMAGLIPHIGAVLAEAGAGHTT